MCFLMFAVWFVVYVLVMRFIPRSVLSEENGIVFHLSCVVLPLLWVVFYPDGTFIGEWLFAFFTGLLTLVLALVSLVLIFQDKAYVVGICNLGISIASAVGLWLVLF